MGIRIHKDIGYYLPKKHFSKVMNKKFRKIMDDEYYLSQEQLESISKELDLIMAELDRESIFSKYQMTEILKKDKVEFRDFLRNVFDYDTEKGILLSQVECRKADNKGTETVNSSKELKDATVYLRAKFHTEGKIKESEGGSDLLVKCEMSYSTNGKSYTSLGKTFQVKEGKWIGAKVGVFCTRPAIVTNDGGCAEVDWFRFTK